SAVWDTATSWDDGQSRAAGMSLQPFLDAGPVIQLHIVAATCAITLGPVALARRSRDRWHKRAGYAWILAMVVLSSTGLFIHTLRLIGPFSPIHLLSLYTLCQLGLAVRDARTGRIAAHRYRMQSLYTLALMLTGAFTLYPGRLMSRILFPDIPVIGFVVIVGLAGLGCAWWFFSVSRRGV
ncbi:MAG: DUF2306 domain-containing protein, partial [Rhodobacteraceae bacterium]|nr:DUF2306 domain-containing protein [Paracoccaceae bacterium]